MRCGCQNVPMRRAFALLLVALALTACKVDTTVHVQVNADGILANGATSAAIRLQTNRDQYMPHVVTFATEIFSPTITLVSVDLPALGRPTKHTKPEWKPSGTS